MRLSLAANFSVTKLRSFGSRTPFVGMLASFAQTLAPSVGIPVPGVEILVLFRPIVVEKGDFELVPLHQHLLPVD